MFKNIYFICLLEGEDKVYQNFTLNSLYVCNLVLFQLYNKVLFVYLASLTWWLQYRQ